MKSQFVLLFIICIASACNKGNDNAQLTLIPAEETVERIKCGNFNYEQAVFKNQSGNSLSNEETQQLNQGKLAKDFYENEMGKIVEIRIRPIELKDKFIEIQRRELFVNPLNEIAIVPIDCEKLDSIYAEVWSSDQAVRNEGGDMELVDNYNRQTVISVINHCGFSEEHLNTIWLVLQHSPSGVMAYYFPTMKAYSNQGLLNKSTMALMEDRMLMNHGYQQIYGSQISSGHLYDLEDPENVNERRAAIGLGPIEEYVKRWNLDFEDEVKRMKSENGV